MKLRLAISLATAAVVLSAAIGGATASVRSEQFRIITLHHAPTHFTIRAPEGFRLEFSRGVYILHKGVTSISFSRLAADVSPAQLGSQSGSSGGLQPSSRPRSTARITAFAPNRSRTSSSTASSEPPG